MLDVYKIIKHVYECSFAIKNSKLFAIDKNEFNYSFNSIGKNGTEGIDVPIKNFTICSKHDNIDHSHQIANQICYIIDELLFKEFLNKYSYIKSQDQLYNKINNLSDCFTYLAITHPSMDYDENSISYKIVKSQVMDLKITKSAMCPPEHIIITPINNIVVLSPEEKHIDYKMDLHSSGTLQDWVTIPIGMGLINTDLSCIIKYDNIVASPKTIALPKTVPVINWMNFIDLEEFNTDKTITLNEYNIEIDL